MIRRTLALAVAATLLVTALLAAHDMFLKPAQFFVAENASLPAILLNGTFDKSSNSINRTRIADLSMVGPKGRTRIDTTAWATAGDTSRIVYATGPAGTYVFAVSTKASEIELPAKSFNGYLKEDGLPDELARRTKARELGVDAKERYSKHVKAIVQVGDRRSNDFATVLGYPAEIVPVDNPYSVKIGGTLTVKALVDGKPLPNALVLYGARAPSGKAIPERTTRAGADGIARVPVASAGVWYVKFISMTRLGKRPDGVTHESKWATLTFAIR